MDDLSDYPRVGCGPLKEAIAAYEHTQKEYLICGNGAADLIFSLCRAQNPKKALLLAPTFAEYEQALVSVGCEIARYDLEETADFCVKENYLHILQKEKPDIIFLCNPNNPTGITMQQELLEKILRRCAETGIFMVVDDFANRIKELRQQQGLSQEKFALKIDMDRTYYASVEAGKRNVSIKNIKKIADGFEISLEELFKNM